MTAYPINVFRDGLKKENEVVESCINVIVNIYPLEIDEKDNMSPRGEKCLRR